jgi:integrase
MRTGKLKFRERYAVMILLGSASGLRPEELLALRIDDIDLRASSFRVDEALDRKNVVGPCKNAAAYRTVLLLDAEGQTSVCRKPACVPFAVAAIDDGKRAASLLR